MEAPCSRCGCDRPFHDRWEKQSKTNYEFREQFKRAMAENAKNRAELELTILELRESQKWMQQKVRKQAAQLRKLEEKLIKVNHEPYAKEEGNGLTVPGPTAVGVTPPIPPSTGFIFTTPPNLYGQTINETPKNLCCGRTSQWEPCGELPREDRLEIKKNDPYDHSIKD